MQHSARTIVILKTSNRVAQASYSWPQYGHPSEPIELHQSKGVELLQIDNTKAKITAGQRMRALRFHIVSLFCLHFPLMATSLFLNVTAQIPQRILPKARPFPGWLQENLPSQK